MKKNKIIFWITTSLIFLLEGVMPALTFQTKMAKDGLIHLGYPQYFGVLLTTFKVLGAVALIIPAIPKRIKEWAYAGFGIELISASVSNTVVDGFGMETIFPLIGLAILIISYVSYHKINTVEL